MKKLLPGLILCIFLYNPLLAASSSHEIEHLLNFVENSGCIFERNGTRFDAAEARAHIQRKYDYIRERVETAEDFIRYAASQSSMSGAKYQATCDSKTLPSEELLTRELQRFRQLSG